MKFEDIENKLKETYGIIKNHIDTVNFSSGDDNFHVVNNGNDFTIYAVTDDGDLLPGFKTAKTINAITKFVNARA